MNPLLVSVAQQAGLSLSLLSSIIMCVISFDFTTEGYFCSKIDCEYSLEQRSYVYHQSVLSKNMKILKIVIFTVEKIAVLTCTLHMRVS